MIDKKDKTFAETLKESFSKYGKTQYEQYQIAGVLADMMIDIENNFLFKLKIRYEGSIPREEPIYIFAEYEGKREQIATLETNNGDFPCTLKYPSRNTAAHDKEGLERALKEMLYDTKVVEKIWAIRP